MLRNAFTGLEAAIVLIAFVVVAALFSYVVLGAGFFTSQTAHQPSIRESARQVQVCRGGNTYGIENPGKETAIAFVNVTLALTAGGTPIDLSSMVVSYTDNNGGHVANMSYEGITTNCPTTAAPGLIGALDSKSTTKLLTPYSITTPNDHYGGITVNRNTQHNLLD